MTLPAELPFPLADVFTNVKVFPSGQATLLAEQLALEHIDPDLTFSALDRTHIFHISGPLAPFPRYQDGIVMVEITPPGAEFKHLKSRGARQAGVSYNSTVFDETEINLVLVATARTAEALGDVVSEWQSMWDPRKLVRFEWQTFDKGLWWCDCRLGKSWNDRIQNSPRRFKRQVITQQIHNEASFWQSVDSLSQFGFKYEDVKEQFDVDFDPGMGPNWPLYYWGAGGGTVFVRNGLARWHDDPDDDFTTRTRDLICGPYKDFHTATDNQVVTKQIDSTPEWSFPYSGGLHLAARMNRNPDDSWAGDGVTATVTFNKVQLRRWNGFNDVLMKSEGIWPPPRAGEFFTLVAGFDGQTRRFRVLRNNRAILNHIESGTASQVGPDHRGVGGGMHAAAALITQATPPRLRQFLAGDNAKVTQSGFLSLTNIGSEDAYPNLVFRGPGTLGVSNGPGSPTMINFGPLTEGQQALISTHPRYRNVIDLTQDPSTAATLTDRDLLMAEIAKDVARNQVPRMLSYYESVFGVLPAQGEMYKLLDGQFTQPIPGVKQPDMATTSRLAVRIVDGNANSLVTAAVTPQRQWPE